VADFDTSTLERMAEIDSQRVRIADAQMKTDLRRMKGVMQITSQMLVRALGIVQETAPHRMAEFPAPEDDAIDRAARDYERRRHIEDVSAACIFCGCTKNNACTPEGKPCHWVAENVCSACVDRAHALGVGGKAVTVSVVEGPLVAAAESNVVDCVIAYDTPPKKLRTRTKPRSAKKAPREEVWNVRGTNYTVRLSRDSLGTWHGFCPKMRGVYVANKTYAAMRERLRAAMMRTSKKPAAKKRRRP
jgi:hypothetical protein